MPVFATPEPITLDVDFPAGDLKVTASDRDDTVVDVRPARESGTDLEYAAAVRVEHSGGTVFIKAPTVAKLRRTPKLDITVALPSGSAMRVVSASGDVVTAGTLADVGVNTASGDIRIEHATTLRARSASGDVRCAVTDGFADVNVTSGDVHLAHVGGDLALTTASGTLQVGHAGGDVTAKCASGRLVIDAVVEGRVSVQSASGDITIGVTEGTAAWLDVTSLSGRVYSALSQADQPAAGERTVELSARSLSGDIAIMRAESGR